LSRGGDANNARPRIQSFRGGLRDLGYADEKNILIEDRYIEKNANEFSGLVAELLQLKVDAPVSALTLKEYEPAARALKIQLHSLEVRGPNPDLESAFQAAANALVTIANPMLSRYRKQIADLATKNRLPSMSDKSGYVEDGFLMSYAADIPDQYRRAAAYVDKILKGSKPADLPVEHTDEV
jgi:ABC-type uncharacterized transport system substrate-binding protein